MKKRIAIVGAGAIGVGIGYHLQSAGADEFFYIASGERRLRLQRDGVYFNGQRFLIDVISPHEVAQPPDLVMLCVKGYHLIQALEDIKPILGRQSIVLSLLNGLDSEEQIAELIGFERVLYGISVKIDATRDKNQILATDPGKIIFGNQSGDVNANSIKLLKGILTRAHFSYELPKDIIHFMWWKFMVNVGVNTVSAVLRMPYGAMQQSKHARKLMEQAMQEVVAVARKVGVVLSQQDIQNWYDIFEGLGEQSKTSTLQDIEAGRKTEIDLFSGKVCSLGEKHGVPTPLNDILWRMINALEERG